MFARLCRALLVLALAPWLAGTAAMPVEHVHEGDAHHHQLAAHRHLDAHQVEADDHDEVERPHDSDRVVWLSNASLHQRAYHLSMEFAVIALSADAPLDSPRWVAAPEYTSSPPHGPPRPYRPSRAPPS
ncbi:MAG: hypothetical protein ABL961_18680, partial [Vicinamibacterales bacterium]